MNKAIDLAAFEAVVQRWRAPVLGYVTRRLSDASAAEDIAQETFLRAWQNWHRLQELDEHPGWLFTTAHRLAVDLVAARQKRGKHASWLSMDTLFYLADPSDRVREVLDREELAELLGALAPTQAAVMLPWLDGVTYQELAELLEIPIGTVKSRLNSARNRLKRVRERIA